jgi:hypothetical protein
MYLSIDGDVPAGIDRGQPVSDTTLGGIEREKPEVSEER